MFRFSSSTRRLCRVTGLLTTIALCATFSSAQGNPSIEILRIPQFGIRPGILEGRIIDTNPTAFRVTALVFVSGLGFHTKPYCSDTTVAVAADGSFSVLLTSGGIDEYASLFAILVVPAAAQVPCYAAEPGVPPALEEQAVAKLIVARPNPNERQIQFAGETWRVKASPAPVGPGPNYFSDSAENAWVDNLGRLHLRITKRGGRWYCAEIISKRPTGYGQYSFQLETPPELDRNITFGGFSWTDADAGTREVDMLEIGKFGNGGDPNNAQYVVQPYTTPGNQKRFFLPAVAPTVHTMTWLRQSLSFQSTAASGTLHQWTYGGQPPVPYGAQVNFRFNLWLVGVPSDGNEAEVVVSSYSFTPDSADFPRVAFRDAWHGIRLLTPSSPAPVELGGVFAGEPRCGC